MGNLGSGTDVREIEETFTPFGALRSVWVSRNPEGCALVWFKDERDAREAVWCLDRRLDEVIGNQLISLRKQCHVTDQ